MTLQAGYPTPMRMSAERYWARWMAGVYWHQVCSYGQPVGSKELLEATANSDTLLNKELFFRSVFWREKQPMNPQKRLLSCQSCNVYSRNLPAHWILGYWFPHGSRIKKPQNIMVKPANNTGRSPTLAQNKNPSQWNKFPETERMIFVIFHPGYLWEATLTTRNTNMDSNPMQQMMMPL